MTTTAEPEWVPTSEAPEVLGASRRQLNRLVEAGKVRRIKRDGRWHYCRADMLACSSSAEDVGDAETDIIGMLTRHIETQQGPARIFAEMVYSVLRAENDALRARCLHLEQLHTELIRAREAMLSEEQYRSLAAKQVEKHEERKDKALGMLGKHFLPRLLGGGGSDLSQLQLTGEQVELLCALDDDIVRPEQKQMLKAFAAKTTNGKAPHVA